MLKRLCQIIIIIVFFTSITDPLQIDEVYYNIVKGKLDTKDIDNFIKSADPSWNIP